MKYHNPENLTEWGQADGWRLLTTEEAKQPLPSDAEFFDEGKWLASVLQGSHGDSGLTYRTKEPLPVSPLIAQLDAEIKAKQELKDIALAVEAGAEWEVQAPEVSHYWSRPLLNYSFEWYVNNGWNVRLKPKPVTRPWNKPEDVPLNCWVRNGQCDNCPSQIIGFDSEGFRIIWHNNSSDSKSMFHHVSWARAAEAWEFTVTLNDPKSWKPCEVTEEAK